MEKKKIDRVIEAFRNYISLKEEMMTTQSTPTKAGFGGSAQGPDPGPTAGFDPKMPNIGLMRRKKIIGLGKNSRNRWNPKKQSQ